MNSSESQIEKIRTAIVLTVVVSANPSHVRKQLFQLAREVKTIIGFDEPFDNECKSVVVEWHKQSGIHLKDESIDILWAQFKTSWNKIKYPTGDAIFLTLIRKAESFQYPPICNDYEDVGKDLTRLCAVLDTYWSPEPFYLSCRHAECVFGYSHAKMATLLELLVLDGVLELVKKGSMGRASRYRFLADKGKINLSSIESGYELKKELY